METTLIMNDLDIYKHWIRCAVCAGTYQALHAGYSPDEIRAMTYINDHSAELDRAGRWNEAEVYAATARRAQEAVLSGRAHLDDQEHAE